MLMKDERFNEFMIANGGPLLGRYCRHACKEDSLKRKARM